MTSLMERTQLGGGVLPMVWAMAETASGPGGEAMAVHRPRVRGLERYRRYTEAMLRRYVKLSMEAGRAPSLLGREMFRGRVTSCQVRSFDDVVIFVHDVERCLGRLDEEQHELIERIALQEYSQGETAAMLGVGLRSVLRRYGQALDHLSRLLLEARLLEPIEGCQEAAMAGDRITDCRRVA